MNQFTTSTEEEYLVWPTDGLDNDTIEYYYNCYLTVSIEWTIIEEE